MFLTVDQFLLSFLIILIGYIVYRYGFKSMQYFQERGIQTPPVVPFFGNFTYIMKHGLRNAANHWVGKYGPVFGVYSGQMKFLYVCDPELIKEVAVKKFNSFPNRMTRVTRHPSGRHIFSTKDDHWKHNRQILTPTFSSSKLRQMNNLILIAVNTIIEKLEHAAKTKRPIEIKEKFGSFTMDVISSTAFGIKVDSESDPENNFVRHAARALSFKPSNWRNVLAVVFPEIFKIISKFYPVEMNDLESADFFLDVANQAIASRKSDESFADRKDFLRLMIDQMIDDETFRRLLKTGSPDVQNGEFGWWYKKGLTREDVQGNSFLFFLAGYETTATTLSFCAYLLAADSKIQERLMEEIDEKLPLGTEPTFENVKELQLLEACLYETLRLFPPVPRLDRIASQNCQIGPYKIDKGVTVSFPVAALHYDANYFPEPTRFNPDRFYDKDKRKEILNSYMFMPFGVGPRLCIGERLALLEMKMVLSKILQRFSFQLVDGQKQPALPQLSTHFFPTAKDGLWLRVVSRTN